jgi:hypothetical protein
MESGADISITNASGLNVLWLQDKKIDRGAYIFKCLPMIIFETVKKAGDIFPIV